VTRREFITAPLAATAQRRTEVRRVGVLANEPWPPLEGLRDGMRGLGYVEKQGLQFEYRFAEGRAERYPALPPSWFACRRTPSLPGALRRASLLSRRRARCRSS
jgi:hypothetical protein